MPHRLCGVGVCNIGKSHRGMPGQRAIVTRNKGYWGKAPDFDKAVFAVVEDPVLSQNMIEGGDAEAGEGPGGGCPLGCG